MKKIRVRWKFPTIEAFLGGHGSNISAEEVLLPTSRPLDRETEVRFEFLLADQSMFLAGRGTVVEVLHDVSGPRGMVLRLEDVSADPTELIPRLRRRAGAGSLVLDDLDDFDDDEDEGLSDDDTRPEAHPAGYRAWKERG